MKTARLIRIALAVVIALLVTMPVLARAKRTAAKPAADAAFNNEFKQMIDEYYSAWSTLNPDNAAKFYAKDADLVFYDVAPLKYNAWSEYRAGVIKAFTEPMSSGKLTPNDDLKVIRRGNIVWTTLTFHLTAKPKAGGAMEVDCRHTAIWEKRGSKWLIVHEHVSAPLPG
ncbi:MAG TPA: nuclear transport factor 2 family protein [Blastocatellia bacterium]|nr:nuclear transport factor 2 family protein [Blastocatellia bacterium]